MGENHFAAAADRALRRRAADVRCGFCDLASRPSSPARDVIRLLAGALGRDYKGKLSLVCYLAAIGLAFVNQWLSDALYLLVAVMWLIPDRRIEHALAKHHD